MLRSPSSSGLVQREGGWREGCHTAFALTALLTARPALPCLSPLHDLRLPRVQAAEPSQVGAGERARLSVLLLDPREVPGACSAVLCCAVLRCTVLCCAVLRCAALESFLLRHRGLCYRPLAAPAVMPWRHCRRTPPSPPIKTSRSLTTSPSRCMCAFSEGLPPRARCWSRRARSTPFSTMMTEILMTSWYGLPSTMPLRSGWWRGWGAVGGQGQGGIRAGHAGDAACGGVALGERTRAGMMVRPCAVGCGMQKLLNRHNEVHVPYSTKAASASASAAVS